MISIVLAALATTACQSTPAATSTAVDTHAPSLSKEIEIVRYHEGRITHSAEIPPASDSFQLLSPYLADSATQKGRLTLFNHAPGSVLIRTNNLDVNFLTDRVVVSHADDRIHDGIATRIRRYTQADREAKDLCLQLLDAHATSADEPLKAIRALREGLDP